MRTWDEIDLSSRVWTVPAQRMKGERDHRVPLSDEAIFVLEQMQAVRSSEFVFPGHRRGKPLSNMSLLMTLRRMGCGELTTHGFRATFKTWASERTAFPREVVEAALAHVIGDKTEAAYQRGDFIARRAKLMEAWSRYCAITADVGKAVVP